MKRILLATVIALTCATAANAQESEAEKSAARLATLFAAISTEGGTTAKDGAGDIEASMLTASALWKAADYLKTNVLNVGTGQVLVLTDQQSVNFAGYIGATRQLDLLKSRFQTLDIQFKAIDGGRCKPAIDAPGSGPVASAALTGFVGALQQKTELAPLKVTATSSMLVKAVAGKMPMNLKAILLDNLPTPDLTKSKFATLLNTTEMRDACWRGVLSTLKENPKKPNPKLTLAIAAIKTTTEDFKSFNENLLKIDDKGQSLFAQAISVENLIETKPSTLRLSMDAAGGTSILKNNFLTLFGFNALQITGGAVISYSYLNAGTIKSGLIVCPTKVTSLGSVHRGQLASEECKTDTPKQTPPTDQKVK